MNNLPPQRGQFPFFASRFDPMHVEHIRIPHDLHFIEDEKSMLIRPILWGLPQRAQT